MKNLHDDTSIFSMSDHLTKEQLVQYHLGQLPKEEQHAVEKHLVDCELCKDALSGITLLPNYEGIDRIRKDIRRIAQPRQNIMDKVAWRNVSVAASVLSLIVFSALFYIYLIRSDKRTVDIKEVAHQESQPTLENSKLDSSVTAGNIYKSEDTFNGKLPPSTLTGKEKSFSSANTNNGSVELIKSKTITSVPENFKFQDSLKLKKTSIPTIMLADLKVIDYSTQYASQADPMSEFETGVQAQHESRGAQVYAQKAKAKETRDISYKKFLEDALIIYKKGKYDDAINMLNLIQRSFPRDLNALFYSGLCYYQLSQWNNAAERFAVSGNGLANPFYEESKWYRALTEIKQEKIPEAKALLSEIINEDGFYKKQAQSKLSELK